MRGVQSGDMEPVILHEIGDNIPRWGNIPRCSAKQRTRNAFRGHGQRPLEPRVLVGLLQG